MFKTTILSMLAFLVVGCSSTPTDTEIKSCILNIQGVQEFGVPKVLGASQIRFDNVIINNILNNDNETEVIATVTFSISLGRSNDWRALEAKPTSYIFREGSDGWTCQGASIY